MLLIDHGRKPRFSLKCREKTLKGFKHLFFSIKGERKEQELREMDERGSMWAFSVFTVSLSRIQAKWCCYNFCVSKHLLTNKIEPQAWKH